MANTIGSDSITYQIFISYARPDYEFAASFYEWLRSSGFTVWMDTTSLKPGQNWDFEINVALQNSSFIVVILSNNSVDRRGYAQKEIKIALDKYKEKLIDDIFIIPLLIDDDIVVPHELRLIQYISSSVPGYENIIAESINSQIEKLGGERRKTQEEKDVYWSLRPKREIWDGLPGYEYEVHIMELSSTTYAHLNEISETIRAHFLDDLFRLRRNKIEQDTGRHSFASNRWSRTDTFHASCGDPTIKNRVVSIKYIVNWYGAGAAHPNHHFATFCFVMDPLFRIEDLRQIFEDQDQAIEPIKTLIIDELLGKRLGDNESALDEEWVKRGVTDWDSFPAFAFKKDGIEFLFPPYQVGPYAAGMFEVELSYLKLKNLISREYQVALGIEYLRA